MRTIIDDWRHRPTHAKVWSLALPMIASNLTVPLVALTDATVAGHLAHANQLAAVAIGSIVYQVPVWAFAFLRMGTVGFTAQAAGRNDGDRMRGILVQALVLAMTLAATSIALALPLLGPVMELMRPTAELNDLARGYLHVRGLGLPAALGNYALMGWFLGAQNARVPMRILIVTNLVNIGLNLLFVLGFGWGVPGIALASVCGEWIGFASGLACIAAQLRSRPGRLHPHQLRRWSSWRGLLGVNRDILVRSLALQGVFFSVTVLGARLGDTVVAANTLLLNGLLLSAYGLDGLANAVEALAGYALGARNPGELRRALVVAGGWSLIGSILFAVLFAFGGRAFVNVQSSIETVRQTAYIYLPYLAVLPVLAVWAYLLDGLFIGAARAREMRDAMLASSLVFALMAWCLRNLGNHGLWLAFLAFTVVRAVLMAAMAWQISRRGGWRGVEPDPAE